MKAEQIIYVFRNLQRKKKQTLFSFLCVGISSLIILGNMSFNNGIQKQLKKGINEGISGNISVYESSQGNINILESQLSSQEKFQFDEHSMHKFSEKFPGLLLNKRIRYGALVAHQEETSFLNLHALTEDHLQRVSELFLLKDGVFPQNESDILISESLAEEIKVNVGDTLLLVADNTNGYMSDAVTAVKGIFQEDGLAIYFDRIGFIKYTFGEDMVQVDDSEAIELIINPDFKNQADISNSQSKEISKYFNSLDTNFKSVSWEYTVPLLFSIVKVWQWGGRFTHIIFLSFSLVILISVSTLVANSRRKEFGTFIAMGFRWWDIYRMMLLEYLLIAIAAISFSVLLLQFTFYIILPTSGLHITSKDLQAALLAEYIPPTMYGNDVLYITIAFILVISISLAITILKAKKSNPVTLINS